ncbi:MAG: cbb3-type cytochrome oxidase assembly protein CcoS [Sulfitobacter sp.]
MSLVLSGAALCAFLWSLRNAQYDDLEGDAWRILSEDDGKKSRAQPKPKDEPGFGG